MALMEPQTELSSGVRKALYLVDLPDYWKTHASDESQIKGGFSWKYIQGKAHEVEEYGQQYHHGNYDKEEKTVMLSLEYESEGGEVIVGYRHYKPDDTASVYYSIYDKEKGKPVLITHDILDKHLATKSFLHIRHAPGEVIERTDSLTSCPENKSAPLVMTAVQSISIQKTGEVFTKPEIFALIFYYDKNGKFVRYSRVDLPFALKKGMNRGFQRLIEWDEKSESVLMVVFEDDRNIPYDIIVAFGRLLVKPAEAIFSGVTGGATTVVTGLMDVLRPEVSKIKEGDETLDESALQHLKKFQEDDLIDVCHIIKSNLQVTDSKLQQEWMQCGGSIELENYYGK